MSFLTVEDVNSTLIKYHNINLFHTINTRNIDIDEFEGVKYDFCIVNHGISGNNHTFEFNIVNSNWTGAYYFLDENDNYLDLDATYDSNDNVLTFTTTHESVKLILYCSSLADEFNIVRLTWRPISLNTLVTSSIENIIEDIPVMSLNNEDLYGKRYVIQNTNETHGEYFNLNSDNQPTFAQTANSNSNKTAISYNGAKFYYDCFVKKIAPNIEINNDLTVGKINRVELSVSYDLTDVNNVISIPSLAGYVYYEDKTIPIQLDSNTGNYYFDLDLLEKSNNNHVKLSLEILETDYVQGKLYNFVIASEYVSVDNVSDFIRELGSNGCKIIELANDFTLFDDVTVYHDIIIYGKDHSLNLNEHSFILNEGLTLKVNKISFNNGDNAIIQNDNTNLELTDCTFYNCKSRNYNNIGSCIFCDVNLESLSVDDDFTTNLYNCTFINNHSAILHGGQLTVDNCKFLNNILEVVDMNNPAFLYQVSGDASISNSIFDIDYSNKNGLCTNSQNIGFAQALFMCGQLATINRANYTYLQSDDTLPFFESPYNNKAHLFVKYYYSQISACVFASPVLNYEDKSCCHAVSGVDWVFKNNVQITRADWESENNINKIDWE
ncbi:MAG: hypothetical protein IJH12_02120 [Clostridia bacterium]|nr:hypothetical protein [Clostridia bacterium]